MGKLAFLYPGQGSQRVGMGADLQAAMPDVYDRYLDGADRTSGLSVRSYSLEGPVEALTSTSVQCCRPRPAPPRPAATIMALTRLRAQTGPSCSRTA